MRGICIGKILSFSLVLFFVLMILNSCNHSKSKVVAKAPEKMLADSKPVFNEDGSIEFGEKKIIPGSDGKILLSLEKGKMIEMEEQFSFGDISWTHAKRFKNKSLKVDQETKTAVFSADLPYKDGLVTYRLAIRLLDDGLARVRSDFVLPEANIPARYANMYIRAPLSYFTDSDIVVDGKEIKVEDSRSKVDQKSKTIVSYAKNSELKFLPEQPDSSYAIKCLKYNISGVKIGKNALRTILHPAKSGKTRTLEFDIDIRERSAEASATNARKPYGGVDFWKNNRQIVPDYYLCKNLVQNPSFEAGLRYFTPNAFGGLPSDPKYQHLYNLDEQVAWKGKNSLKIDIFKELKSPTSFGTFVIPLKRGQEYTISFYAKADRLGTRLRLHGFTCLHPTYLPLKNRNFTLTKDWKRYFSSFVAPNTGGGIYFTAKNSKSDGHAWIDGIQLEEGPKATEFVEKPVVSRLISSNPDNFIKHGDSVDAKLLISTAPSQEGEVKIAVEDFFGKKLFEDDFSFETDSKGMAEIELDFDELPKGIFNVRTDFVLENGFRDNDFHRLAIMKQLTGKHKHRAIFSNGLGYGPPRVNDIIQRLKHLGMGSICKHKKDRHKIEEAARNGIRHSGGSIDTHRRGVGVKNPINIKKLKSEDLTPEFLKKFEDACAETVAAHPWIEDWYLAGEPNDGRYPLAVKDFVKLFAAGYRGMKKASPNSKYIIPATWNMCPGSGILWQDSFIKACEGLGIKWGVADIHVYRHLPEQPDLDTDAATYFEMLEKNGLGDLKVNWGEGIFYMPYNIPDWGISCYRDIGACDHYYLTSPSYDMGWGEKISAAFYARSWLVALKYADKVNTLDGWSQCNRFFMDAYLTPFAVQKIPNTLSNLLGDADFKYDIRFAPNVRAYLFEDQEGRPVAAMWSYFDKVDRGLEKAPSAFIPFGDQNVEIFDLMEASIEIEPDDDGRWKITAGPFPVFLRGEKGSMEKFKNALNAANLDKKGIAPVKVASGASVVNRADIAVINLLTKKFTGRVTIDSAEKISKNLFLPSMARETIYAPLKEPISNQKIVSVKLPVSIEDKKSNKTIDVDASFRAFAVRKNSGEKKIDANLDDWSGIPFIKIINKNINPVPAKFKADPSKLGDDKDFSARFKMAWDEKFLYLAVKVEDNLFVADDRGAVSRHWNNDTLQVFIDTFGDARGKFSLGSDANDYNYDFFPKKDASLTAFRRGSPDEQLCGNLKCGVVEPAIKRAFKFTKTGYVYEIAFPARYLLPMRLKIGFSCGLALYLNDHDGKYIKQGRTMTPEGTGAYMKPHLYPVMLLTE